MLVRKLEVKVKEICGRTKIKDEIIISLRKSLNVIFNSIHLFCATNKQRLRIELAEKELFNVWRTISNKNTRGNDRLIK